MEILALDMNVLLAKGLQVLYAALGLGLVIFFHELGHFAVAKWCDVFVERFSIGFGPILWSFKKGETEYALSAIPFGGYVKMLGQDDMDPSQLSAEEIALDPRSYSAKNVPQRMAIISAGVIMNVVTGLLFFGSAFHFGVETAPATVGQVIAGKPAWVKGMQPGDEFTRINGRATNEFQDVLRGTTLSRGDIEIEGIHPNGDTFRIIVEPDKSGLRRMIGVSDARSLKVAAVGEKEKRTTIPGTPAAAAKTPFEENDVITAVNGEAVDTHAALMTVMAENRSSSLEFSVDRAGKSVEIEVESRKFRELGLWMDIEQVSAIQEGSVAAKAGLKIGDKITAINGQAVGTEINALHLADHFETLAGQEVEVRVKRTVEGTPEPEEVKLTLTPADSPAWMSHPLNEGTPLSIPSLGVAYHLTSNVLRVVPDSPAAKAGVQEGGALASMKIESKDPAFNQVAAKKSVEIKFNDPAKKNVKNMAYACWQLQAVPSAKVTLTFQGDEKAYELEPVASSEEWYVVERGIIFAPRSKMLLAKTIPEALSMATTRTQNSAIDIYLTIRNLVVGDLSVKNLHGPVGIAKVAFIVSERGLPDLLLFLGFLSINLAVLNFLPIPVLDGGHMVFLIWEGVTRRRPSERVLIAATYLGMAFVLGLMVFVIYLDIFVHRLGV